MGAKSDPRASRRFPEEVLASIEGGMTQLTAVRQWKHMTVIQLASLSGVSVSVINAAEEAVNSRATRKLIWRGCSAYLWISWTDKATMGAAHFIATKKDRDYARASA